MDIIGTDHPLTSIQRGTLNSLLQLMVPPSPDGLMPSAAEIGFVQWLSEVSPALLPGLVEGLDGVAAWSQEQIGTDLPSNLEDNTLAELRAAQAGFLNHLAREVMACYYQHPAVLSGLGVRSGPPFPDGNDVEPGDLSLLEPVIARGRIYRDV